jgi:uncharacterized membrane protein YphA (DoxX/SURF4 family)
MQKVFLFEQKYRTQLVWLIRILIACLFIISAIAKVSPIELFEKQLVDIANKPGPIQGFTNWCTVTVWSRTIIITELFLGVSMLIPFYQRTVTIPMSIAMLLMFIIHLFYQIMVFGNVGNCGCMGELIPMSPLSAIIKNTFTIVFLIYLFLVDKKQFKNIPTFHLLMLPVIIISIFLFFPIKKSCCCEAENDKRVLQELKVLSDRIDTLKLYINKQFVENGDSISKVTFTPSIETRSEVSEFHSFQKFNFQTKRVLVNLDKGKKIVCVLNPDCDHCKDLVKKLSVIKNQDLADIHFLFYNPDAENDDDLTTQIQAFFNEVGISEMWNIIDINSYVRLLENAPSPPRLVILENGKIIYDYIGEGQLDISKVKRLGRSK